LGDERYSISGINIFVNTYESSIYDVEEVAVKKENSIPIPINIKTKTKNGKNSIFVEAFQAIRTFPARPNLNYYDPVEKRIIKPSVILQAHLTCMKQVQNLPRQIIKKDKSVKFDKNYSGLFKKNENYERFLVITCTWRKISLKILQRIK
jgi:hypothetical protein